MPTTSTQPTAANAYYSSRSPPIGQNDGYNATQNAGYFDPYAATGGASHYTTPAPLNTQAAAGHPMRSPTHTSSVGMPQAHGRDPSYSDSPPVYDAATAHPPGMWSAKPSGR